MYDAALNETKIEKNPSYYGKMTFALNYPVTEKYLNSMGGVHGGAIACWVDVVTSIAIYALDPKSRMFHVSAQMSIDYIDSAREGAKLEFVAIVHKIGRSLAFTSCELFQNGKLFATGTHKKAFVIAKI